MFWHYHVWQDVQRIESFLRFIHFEINLRDCEVIPLNYHTQMVYSVNSHLISFKRMSSAMLHDSHWTGGVYSIVKCRASEITWRLVMLFMCVAARDDKDG